MGVRTAAVAALLVLLAVATQSHAGGFTEEQCDVKAKGAICMYGGKKVMLPSAVPKSMVGHWTFDESAVVDSSGNKNHASNNIPVGPGVGGRGASAFLNGFDYVEIPHSKSLAENGAGAGAGAYSVTFWVYLMQKPVSKGVARDCPIVFKGKKDGKAASPNLQINTDTRKLTFSSSSVSTAGDKPVKSEARLPVKRWAHVALVRSEDKLLLYVNGLLDGETASGSGVKNEEPLYVGGVPWLRDECNIKMYVDEMRFYSRAVQAVEIQAEAQPATGGAIQPSYMQLACTKCSAKEASEKCPADFHVCTKMELHTGVYEVARNLGYAAWKDEVINHEDVEKNPTKAGMAMCCSNVL